MKKTGLLVVSIIAFVLFGACAFFLRDLLFGGVKGTYEEVADNYEAYSEQWISYEVVACLGNYAEETESYSFIPTGHEYYYIIMMEDGSVMPMTVSKKTDREYLDALTDATYDYFDGVTKTISVPPREFIGTVKAQKSDAEKYYKEGLDYLKISEKEGWVIRHVLLDCTSSRASTILLVGGVMLIPVFGFVTYFVNAAKEKKKKLNPEEEYLPR